MLSDTPYDDGVCEDGYLIRFSDGRVATKVRSIPPGETRWVLILKGDPTSGVGVVSSLSSNSQEEVVTLGSIIQFSGGTEELPPSFSALTGSN